MALEVALASGSLGTRSSIVRRLVLAFGIPFLTIAGCVGFSSGNPAVGVLCGGAVGGLFVVAFAIASTRLSHPLGQAFGALLFLLGFTGVLLGVAFFGCRFIAF